MKSNGASLVGIVRSKNYGKRAIETVCYFILSNETHDRGESHGEFMALQRASASRTTIDRCSIRYWNSEWIAGNRYFSFCVSLLFFRFSSRSRNEIPRVESGPLKRENNMNLHCTSCTSAFTVLDRKWKCPCKIGSMEDVSFFSSFSLAL